MADNPNILFPSTSSSGDGTDPSIICCNTPFIPNYSAYEVITLSKNPPTDILVNGSSLNSKYDYYIYDSLEDSYASFYINLSVSSYLQINICFPNENNEYLNLGPSLYYGPAQGSGNCTLPFLTQKNVKYCCITTKNRSTAGYIYKIPFMKSSLQFSPSCSELNISYNSVLLDFNNGVELEYLPKSIFSSKPYYVYYLMPFDGMIQINIQAGSANTFSNWGSILIIRNSIQYNYDSIKCTNGINYINCYAKQNDEVVFIYYYTDGTVNWCKAYPFFKQNIITE